MALDPGFLLALNNRGVTYAQKGDYERAIPDFEAALRIDPQSDSAVAGLADARVQRDRRIAAGGARELPTFDCSTAKRPAEKAIC